jgi:hypothetical protein
LNRMSEREMLVELPFAADCCPCVEKLRTVLPLTAGIRDGAVQLVFTLGSVVTSARAELQSSVASIRRYRGDSSTCVRLCWCVCMRVGFAACLISARCVLVSALRLSPGVLGVI